MNAYFCDAGCHSVVVEYIEGWALRQDERVYGLAVAETRGQAKSLFTRANSRDIEFCDVRHVRKVASDVDGPARMVEDPEDPAHYLWDQVWAEEE